MDLGIKFLIYLLAFFALIVLALFRILPVNYFGEIVIVAGTRGIGGIKKAILGSVANGLAHYAKCSVLITK